MTLNYWMMMKRYPNLKEEVGGLTPNRKISSLLDKKLAKWSTTCFGVGMSAFCLKKNKKTKQNKTS
jgi:hypothetical protein